MENFLKNEFSNTTTLRMSVTFKDIFWINSCYQLLP